MATIVVDAGHGGYDSGAVFNGRKEKDDALALALEVGNQLRRAGFDVVFTRTDDVYQTPAEKARIANETGADFFVSIHRNSSEFPGQYTGVQTLINNPGGIKEEIAEDINENLEELGFANQGISIRPNLAVLRRTNMPAILVEAGFINNTEDNLLFDRRFQEIAEGIAEAIADELEDERDYMFVTQEENTTQPGQYWVLTGLFTNQSEATAQVAEIKQSGHSALVIKLGDYFAVVVGPYAAKADAEKHATHLTRAGYDAGVILV